jgi:hypothetical protein
VDQRTNTFDSAPSGDLRDGRWHHLAVVFDRQQGRQRYYVDGKAVASLNIEGKFTPDDVLESLHTLKIGMNDGHGYTSGLIDEVALFQRALTAEEIRRLYR